MASPEPDLTIPQFATKPDFVVNPDPAVDLSGHDVTMIMAPWKGGPVVASGSVVVTASGLTYEWRGSGDTRFHGLHRAVFVGDDGLRLPTNGSYIVEVIEAPGDAG